MGVKIVNLVIPVMNQQYFSNFMGKVIAIDAFNSIYQFLSSIKGADGLPLMDYNRQITSHLVGMMNRVTGFLEEGIKPLYVFDGIPHKFKRDVIESRKIMRLEQTKKMDEHLDSLEINKAKKYSLGNIRITSNMFDECRQLLKYMGIPYVNAIHDGEGECARLVNNNIAFCTASQDYDSFLFGSKRLVRNFSFTRERKQDDKKVPTIIEYYVLERVLSFHQITQNQLIDIGIMTGTDFFSGFKFLGEKTALGLIKKYGDIETIIEKNTEIRGKKIEMDIGLLNDLRSIFKNVETPEKIPKLTWNALYEDELKELLISIHNFNPERVENIVKRLKIVKYNKKQVGIERFMC